MAGEDGRGGEFRAPPPKFYNSSELERQSGHVMITEKNKHHHESEMKQQQSATNPATVRPEETEQQFEDWTAVPEEYNYSLEVLKSGQILKVLPLSEYCREQKKGFVTMGRSPENDIEVQHPSSSRRHVVILFDKESASVSLYDRGSTHGTFLNKSRIPTRERVKIRVGDQMRIGESGRVYLLSGPISQMPEEGMNREQKRQMRAMEALEKRKEYDEMKSKEQMAMAMAKGGNVFENETQLYAGDFDWRGYAAKHELTEKQQKLADKIRKKERRIEGLSRERDAIVEKGRRASSGLEDGLSHGQIDTLARNDTEIDRLVQEMEDLEDTLVDSIQDSIQGKLKQSLNVREFNKGRKRNREGEDDFDSDEDIFYDRTRLSDTTQGKKGGKALDALELTMLLQSYTQEKDQMIVEIRKEEIKEQRGKADSGEDKDILDDFMAQVESSIERTRVSNLKHKLQNLEARIQETTSLLQIADPGGLYKNFQNQSAAAPKVGDLEAQKKVKENDLVLQQSQQTDPHQNQRGDSDSIQPITNSPQYSTMQHTEKEFVRETQTDLTSVFEKHRNTRSEIAASLQAIKKSQTPAALNSEEKGVQDSVSLLLGARRQTIHIEDDIEKDWNPGSSYRKTT